MEDSGEGVQFNVYCYNVQPGITIDYATGDSHLSESDSSVAEEKTYILNTKNSKFHLPTLDRVLRQPNERKK